MLIFPEKYPVCHIVGGNIWSDSWLNSVCRRDASLMFFSKTVLRNTQAVRLNIDINYER